MGTEQSSRTPPTVRRVVTPARAGTLTSPHGASGADPVRRIDTPARRDADTEEQASRAIRDVPGVARLASPFPAAGAVGLVSSGHVSVRAERMRASVVIDGGRPIPELERDIRERVGALWRGPLDLEFADLERPGEGTDEDTDEDTDEVSGESSGASSTEDSLEGTRR